MNPVEFLKNVSEKYPDAWQLVERLFLSRGTSLPEWPPYVFFPLAGWYSVTCHSLGVKRLCLPEIPVMHTLATFGTWRITQDIVQFDPDACEAITKTALDGTIPADALLQLPSWCLYIVLPDNSTFQGKEVDGVFAFLEHDVKTNSNELRLSFLHKEEIIHVLLHLGDWGLTDTTIKSHVTLSFDVDTGPKKSIHKSTPADIDLKSTINLLLYLCAYGLTFIDASGNESMHGINRPEPQIGKNGRARFFPPTRPNEHIIGVNIGDGIREAQEQGTLNSLRKPYWYGEWYGSIKQRPGREATPRRFDVHWAPPVGLNPDED